MAKRTQWIPHFTTGNAVLDEQHQQLLAQCNALADCLGDSREAGGDKFPGILEKLMASVRDHFATEKELLSSNSYPMLDEHEHEGEEFEYLASEILSTENSTWMSSRPSLPCGAPAISRAPRCGSGPIWKGNRRPDAGADPASGIFEICRFFPVDRNSHEKRRGSPPRRPFSAGLLFSRQWFPYIERRYWPPTS